MFTKYNNLNDTEKKEISRIIQLLMKQTFILEKKYDNLKQQPTINRDFRILENYKDIINQILNMSGFELEDYSLNGVYRIQSPMQNIVKFSKEETIYILTLRILYEEKQQSISTNKNIIVSFQEILDKLKIFKLLDKLPYKTSTKETFNTFRRYQLLDLISGEFPNQRFILYPTMQYLFTSLNIKEILNNFNNNSNDNVSLQKVNTKNEEEVAFDENIEKDTCD